MFGNKAKEKMTKKNMAKTQKEKESMGVNCAVLINIGSI